MTLSPSSIDLFTTQDCNLRCSYCYIPKQPQRMTGDTARAAVDWLLSVCPRNRAKVFFFGGEPLLEFGLMQEVVAYGRAAAKVAGKTFSCGVTTNGTIWSDEIDAWCRKVGCGVNLSMDGGPGAQNRNRATKAGGETYHLVKRTLLALLARHPKQGIRMTYDAGNVGDLAANVRHVFGLGCRSVFPAPAIETTWTEELLVALERQLMDLAREVVQRGPRDYRRVGNIEKAVQKLSRAAAKPRQSRRGRYQCGAGHSYLAVACDGSIWPCHRFVGLGAYRMGDVWGGIASDACETWSCYDCNTMMPGCYACPARDICSGNCAAVNYAANGTLSVPSLTQCAITRIEARVGRWMLRHADTDIIKRMTGKREREAKQ